MKIAAMDQTEIFINETGAISIRQISPMGENDHVIAFPHELAPVITAEILRLAEKAKNIAPEARSDDGDEEPI
jgi:hypothetical protein